MCVRTLTILWLSFEICLYSELFKLDWSEERVVEAKKASDQKIRRRLVSFCLGSSLDMIIALGFFH